MKPKTETPSDVAWVWVIQQSGQPVGLQTYEEIERVIDENPEYFPWEHKFKSIPKEVYQAYRFEAFPPRELTDEEFLLCYNNENLINKEGNPSGKSIMEQIGENKPTLLKTLTGKEIADMFRKSLKEDEKRLQDAKTEHNRLKAIWDKHYAIYKLEFRG